MGGFFFGSAFAGVVFEAGAFAADAEGFCAATEDLRALEDACDAPLLSLGGSFGGFLFSSTIVIPLRSIRDT